MVRGAVARHGRVLQGLERERENWSCDDQDEELKSQRLKADGL